MARRYRRYDKNYIIINKKSSDIQGDKYFVNYTNSVRARTNIFSINKNPFWSYNSYLSELLINGYIRELISKCHPTDIINLTFLYYQTLTPSFTIHSVLGDVFNLYRAEWIQDEKKLDKTSNIMVKKSVRNIIEPNSESQWCEKSEIRLNNISYPLLYIFSIKSVDNMLNNNVYIGIRSNDPNKKRWRTAYLVTPIKYRNNNKNIFEFRRYKWWNKKESFMNDLQSDLLNVVLTPKSTKNDKKYEISLILNCSIWRLYFLFDGKVLNAVNVEKNKCYIPLIVTNKSESIQYQVIKMKCNVNINTKYMKFYKQEIDAIDRYIFNYRNDGYFGGWIETINAVSTSNHVCTLLWKGYKLFHFNGSNNLFRVMSGIISGYLSKKIGIILEIYKYFWNEYRKYIEYMLSNMYHKYSNKIALIITNFVIENYHKEYKIYKQNDRWIGGMIQPKLYKGFKIWFAISGYCPTCWNMNIDNFLLQKTKPYEFENNTHLYPIVNDEDYIYKNYQFRSYNGEKRRWKTQKIQKRKSYSKRKNDKKGNYESIKRFKTRYQLSLQY